MFHNSYIDMFTVIVIWCCFHFIRVVFSSEATQCVTLFSRQGTNDTIDEAEDERDQVEDDRETAEQGRRASQDKPEGADHEEVMLEETADEVEEEVQWDLADPDEEVEDVQVPELEREDHPEEEQCDSEDEEGEHPIQEDEGESSGPENVQTDVVSGQLFTPDTDAPNTSDADVPPSYSKAVSFDRLSVSDESDSDKRLMVMTPDSRSDLDDPLLPSTTTDLTASELLLNKWVVLHKFCLGYVKAYLKRSVVSRSGINMV